MHVIKNILLILTGKVCFKYSMLALNMVYHGIEPQSRQIKDYKVGICCFSTKHTALMRKS